MKTNHQVANLDHLKIANWPSSEDLKTCQPLLLSHLVEIGTQVQNRTELYLYTNDGYLNCYFKCYDQDINHLVYNETGRDGDIWKDDNVEVFIDTGAKDIYKLSANPIGAFSDSLGKSDWDIPDSVESQILKDRWEVLLKVPLKDLNLQENNEIKANFSRLRYGRNRNITEETAWQRTGTLRAGVREKFGTLIIPKEASINLKKSTMVDLPKEKDFLDKLSLYFKNKYNQNSILVSDESKQIIIKNKLLPLDGRIDPNLNSTEFHVKHNSKDLIVSVFCEDPQPEFIKSSPDTKRGDLWRDDTIELFLSPNRKSNSKYIHIVVNASNVKVVEWGKGKKQEQFRDVPEVITNTKINKNGWESNLIIKNILSDEFYPDTHLWGFNLTRYMPTRPATPEQSSSWSLLKGNNYHNSSNFGVLYINRPHQITESFKAEVLNQKELDQLKENLTINFKNQNFNFLSEYIQNPEILQNQITAHFRKIQAKQIEERETRTIQALENKKAKEFQEESRKNFIQSLGGFPEKTPLNEKITKVYSAEDFDVYNMLFESMPKHYVTANIYVPTKNVKEKMPAILRLIGHSSAGKNGTHVLAFAENMAKLGYITLVMDSLGQGERIYVNNGNGSKTPTSNHFAMGMQGVLVGDHLAKYFIWDGIRAIDYLLSRNDVDPNKLLVTGASGGGTVTSYLIALDNRISGAASNSAMSSDVKKFGSHDSEQMLIGIYKNNIDSQARASMAAPKPFMVFGEYNTEENLKNNHEMIDNARKFYINLKNDNGLTYIPTEFPHGYNIHHREIFYKWAAENFPNQTDQSAIESKQTFKDIDVTKVTKTWKVYYSPETSDYQSPIDLFKKQMLSYQSNWFGNDVGEEKKCLELINKVKALLRYDEPQVADLKFIGQIPHENLAINKAIVINENISIPALFIHPKEKKGHNKILIWLNDRGKDIVMKLGYKQLQQKISEGYTICIPDISGSGELAKDTNTHHYSMETDYFGAGLLLDKPYLAFKIENTHSVFKAISKQYPNSKISVFANSFSDINPTNIRQDRLLYDSGLEDLSIGEVTSSVVALIFTAIEKRVDSLETIKGLSSFSDIYDNFYYYIPVNTFVAGLLKECDLPDIAQTIFPRKITITNPVSCRNQYQKNEASKWNGLVKKYQGNANLKISFK